MRDPSSTHGDAAQALGLAEVSTPRTQESLKPKCKRCGRAFQRERLERAAHLTHGYPAPPRFTGDLDRWLGELEQYERDCGRLHAALGVARAAERCRRAANRIRELESDNEELRSAAALDRDELIRAPWDAEF